MYDSFQHACQAWLCIQGLGVMVATNDRQTISLTQCEANFEIKLIERNIKVLTNQIFSFISKLNFHCYNLDLQDLQLFFLSLLSSRSLPLFCNFTLISVFSCVQIPAFSILLSKLNKPSVLSALERSVPPAHSLRSLWMAALLCNMLTASPQCCLKLFVAFIQVSNGNAELCQPQL